MKLEQFVENAINEIRDGAKKAGMGTNGPDYIKANFNVVLHPDDGTVSKNTPNITNPNIVFEVTISVK